MDYYSVLGVNRDASPDDIKKSYRKLASKHHPDKGGDKAKFQEIQQAYDTLSNPEKRQQYDNPAHNVRFNVNTDNMEDIFGSMFHQFGFNPFHQGGRQQQRNRDIRINLEIPLHETLVEQTKIINIKTEKGGQENVNITVPRGVDTGTSIKYAGLGDDSNSLLPRGDLYVTIHVMPNPKFMVNGLDVFHPTIIDSFDAMLGTECEIETLSKKRFSVKIPAGCQPGTKLKIPGEGLYAFRNDIRGNLYVVIQVKTPTDLTEHQLQLIRSAKEWQQ